MPKTTSVERLERNVVAQREMLEIALMVQALAKLLEELKSGGPDGMAGHA